MFYSLHRLLRQIRRRKELGAAFLVLVIIAAISGNTLTYVVFDDATISDGLWFSVVSITTIGYGMSLRRHSALVSEQRSSSFWSGWPPSRQRSA